MGPVPELLILTPWVGREYVLNRLRSFLHMVEFKKRESIEPLGDTYEEDVLCLPNPREA